MSVWVFPVEEARRIRRDGETSGPDAAVLALRFRHPEHIEAAARGEPWIERIVRERPCWLLLRHSQDGSILPAGDGPAAAAGGVPCQLEVEARPVKENAGAEGVDAAGEGAGAPSLMASLIMEEAPGQWKVKASWECELRGELDRSAGEDAPASIPCESFTYRGKVTENRDTLLRILATPFTVAIDATLIVGTAGLITILQNAPNR